MKRNKSESLFEQAQILMPGGVNSPVRAFKNVDGKPVFFKSAKGPTLIDEDDNQYIDFIGSWGPMILGHSNPVVLNAIKEKPDYIALGSFFKSRLKPKAKKAQKNLVKWTKKRTNLPIVAIGGINNKNYKSLIRFGVNYLAISSYIWNNPRLKPNEAIKKFKLK